MRRLSLWIPVVACMAIIYYVSSLSKPVPALTALVWDKALHSAEYAVLAGLWCRALRGEGLGWVTVVVLALAATGLYGASDEWHQAFVAMRRSDIHDWLADFVGGCIGVAAYRLSSRTS